MLVRVLLLPILLALAIPTVAILFISLIFCKITLFVLDLMSFNKKKKIEESGCACWLDIMPEQNTKKSIFDIEINKLLDQAKKASSKSASKK
tara:strand:+ start:407 stop:682 length:276 start_codon:yes stop_codon:yes gene_type:complete